jgi:membrane protein
MAMKARLATAWGLVRDVFSAWSATNAPRLAAALSYYTIFSIAPLLIVVIAVAGVVFGREAVQGEIVAEIGTVIGKDSADAIQQLIARAQHPAASGIASIIGIITLLFGAAGVMNELKDALNAIWEVPPRPTNGIIGLIRQRFLSFALVLAIGFVLLVSLAISAALTAASRWASAALPGSDAVWMVLSLIASLVVIAVLFAVLFKLLPDAEVRWSDVWIGALVTAISFDLGKLALGVYLGRAAIGSAYGAAGSLVVMLVWVYYSAQIVFLGAEFTRVYARRFGSGIVPSGSPRDAAAAPPVGHPAHA